MEDSLKVLESLKAIAKPEYVIRVNRLRKEYQKLSDRLGVPFSELYHHHLVKLAEAGLIDWRKSGVEDIIVLRGVKVSEENMSKIEEKPLVNEGILEIISKLETAVEDLRRSRERDIKLLNETVQLVKQLQQEITRTAEYRERIDNLEKKLGVLSSVASSLRRLSEELMRIAEGYPTREEEAVEAAEVKPVKKAKAEEMREAVMKVFEKHKGEKLKYMDIAREAGIDPKYLGRILTSLVKKGKLKKVELGVYKAVQ